MNQDWISFQEMFYPRKRARSVSQDVRAPIYLVEDQGLVISASSEGEDLSPWLGLPVQEAIERYAYLSKDRKVVTFTRQDVDRWILESTTHPNFYEQVEFLRQQAAPQGGTQFNPHFVIQAMNSWWGKVLPSAYGIYLSIQPPAPTSSAATSGSAAAAPSQAGVPPVKHLLMLVRRGKFDQFHEPDLSSLGNDRRHRPDHVVKYLTEKHLVPVQGVFVSANEWQEWADAANAARAGNPWRKVAQSMKANRTQLVPFRWGVASLIATRAFL
ncbi:MAG: hypothetical protein H7222_07740 [Methylotenera sp.]|nr:hypothetical protein [Oligoflexia bacterium]